jgi:hypothetical protein
VGDVKHDYAGRVVDEHDIHVAALCGCGPARDQFADLLFVGRASFCVDVDRP